MGRIVMVHEFLNKVHYLSAITKMHILESSIHCEDDWWVLGHMPVAHRMVFPTLMILFMILHNIFYEFNNQTINSFGADFIS